MAMTDKTYYEILNEVWFQRNKIISRTGKDPTRVFMSIRLVMDLVKYHREHVQVDHVNPNLIRIFGIKICRSQDLEYNETHVV